MKNEVFSLVNYSHFSNGSGGVIGYFLSVETGRRLISYRFAGPSTLIGARNSKKSTNYV